MAGDLIVVALRVNLAGVRPSGKPVHPMASEHLIDAHDGRDRGRRAELCPKVGDGGIFRWRIMAAVEAAKHLEKE